MLRELRSHMPWGMDKKKKREREREKTTPRMISGGNMTRMTEGKGENNREL